jgi:hypothetical protein
MGKGDGWAVKRYPCPDCRKKGMYRHSIDKTPYQFRCMYCGKAFTYMTCGLENAGETKWKVDKKTTN